MVGASTVSESNGSGKTGKDGVSIGHNAAIGSLDRVRVDSTDQPLTTNQGVPVSDNQSSLKAGLRGPTLLEDFILREKIAHFDHERIPERIVHARGSAAHGYFECTKALQESSRAALFAEVGKQTPVFVRFSTVLGERGSRAERYEQHVDDRHQRVGRHFANVGDTLRQGIELGASGVVNAVRWGAAYSFLRARFDTPLTLSSPNHPDEEDGEIDVEAGSRIPGVPQHNWKANLSATIKRLTVGGSVLTTSNQYLHGDEANLLAAIDGFTVVNLTANDPIANRIRLTRRVTNLLGSEHSTFGLLGEADEVLGDDYEDPRFLSPGAPRAAWVGIAVSFR